MPRCAMTTAFTIVAVFLAVAGRAAGHEIATGDLTILHPFVKQTPPRAKVGAGYMILVNAGDKDDRLLAIESAAAKSVEIHRAVESDGMTKMGELMESLVIPAHGKAVVGEDGLHAMFIDIGQPFGLGQLIDATLVFEHAGRVEITFEVEPLLGNVETILHQHPD